MEIGQVRIGNFTFGTTPQVSDSEAQEQAAVSANQENNQPQISPEDFYEASAQIGLVNKMQINSSKPTVETFESLLAKAEATLGEDRIKDIQAGMVDFEAGVDETANLVAGELPNVSEAVKNQIAAEVFAKI